MSIEDLSALPGALQGSQECRVHWTCPRPLIHVQTVEFQEHNHESCNSGTTLSAVDVKGWVWSQKAVCSRCFKCVCEFHVNLKIVVPRLHDAQSEWKRTNRKEGMTQEKVSSSRWL